MTVTDLTAIPTRAVVDTEGAAPASIGSIPLPGQLGTRVLTARIVGGLGLALVLLNLPSLLGSVGPAYAAAFGLVVGMAVLSVSVLGWIGEISLATLAQMGVGLVVVNLAQEAGVPFAAILVLVVLASIPISLIIGVFALRLRGVSFAIATLAFAFLAQKTFFQGYLGVQGGFGGTDSKAITRPSLVRTDEALYVMMLVAVVILAGGCYLIRRSWIGTNLDALRDSEMAFAVLGHSPAAYKLFTICLSGAIATLAGAFFAVLQLLVPSNYFAPGLAILYFGFAVVGGLGSISGAIAAGLIFGSLPKYVDAVSAGKFAEIDLFFAGLLALPIILFEPGGFAAIGRRLWRRVEGTAA